MIQTVAKHRYFIGRRAKQSVKEYTNYVTFRSGRDASKGGRKFFDKKRDEIAATTVQEALKAQDDKFVVAHELILSPGVQSVDSKDYTRDLLEKLERSKGLDLEWHAVSHKSDHNHIHVMIGGTDVNGHRVLLRRKDYENLRQWGDEYLEKYHSLDRFLARQEIEIERDYELRYERTKGDRLYELLYKKEEEESVSQIMSRWDREKAIAELPDEEKIYIDGEVYHKYLNSEELEHLDSYLKSIRQYIPKEEYRNLYKWMKEKETYGDDHHERLAREGYARSVIESMDRDDNEVKKELEEKLARLVEEREARYKEEDEKREQERLEADQRLEEDRAKEDDRREQERKEEEERLELSRREEDGRRERERLEQEESRQEEDRRAEERLEQERQEEDRRVQEQRRREEIELKLELAKQAQEEKAKAELARKEEAHKTVRDFKQIDRELKRRSEGYSQSPGEKLFGKKGREQRLHEKCGRETEWHIRYQNSMSRKALEEKLMRQPDLKESIDADIARIKEIEQKQLKGEKIKSIDLDSLEVNANKYLFGEVVEKQAENKEQDKEAGDEKQEDSQASEAVEGKKQESDVERDKDESVESYEPISNRLPAPELEELKQRVEEERQLAKEIKFLVTEDGTRLDKESSREDLEDYSEEITQKIRSNWDEGRGYVIDDEVRWTAVDGWLKEREIEEFREKYILKEAIEDIPRLMSREQGRFDMDLLEAITSRADEIESKGFEDQEGHRFSVESEPEELAEKSEQLRSVEFDPVRLLSEEDYRNNYIEASAQNVALNRWIQEVSESRVIDEKTEDRLEAIEEAEAIVEKLEGGPLEKFREGIQKAHGDLKEKVQGLFGKSAKDEALNDQYSDHLFDIDSKEFVKELEAIEDGRELRELSLEDGTVITPESSDKDLKKGYEEIYSKLSEMRESGERSDDFYKSTAESSAVTNWQLLRAHEKEADESGTFSLYGLEVELKDGKLFDEGTSVDTKLDRLNEVTEHLVRFDMQVGIRKSSLEEHGDSLREDVRMILDGHWDKSQVGERSAMDLFEFEHLKGLDEEHELLKGLEAYKDEHSEKLISRDDLDRLFNLPDDERDVSRQQEVIDRGDSGDKGDLGLGPEIEDTGRDISQPLPEIETSQPEVSKDDGIVDNMDGFKGRDDESPDRDDDGLSR